MKVNLKLIHPQRPNAQDVTDTEYVTDAILSGLYRHLPQLDKNPQNHLNPQNL